MADGAKRNPKADILQTVTGKASSSRRRVESKGREFPQSEGRKKLSKSETHLSLKCVFLICFRNSLFSLFCSEKKNFIAFLLFCVCTNVNNFIARFFAFAFLSSLLL